MINQFELLNDLINNPVLKKYLLNKLLVFSVSDQNNRDQLRKMFKKITGIGEKWWSKNYYVNENYDLMDKQYM